MTAFHGVISNFKKIVLLLTKDFLSRSFHSFKFFHQGVGCVKNITYRQFDRIKYVFEIWFYRSDKRPIVDLRLGSKYASVNITLHLTFFKRT